MFHIALYEPEIPPNTGNIIRLCANTGAQLHLIHPLGFDMNVKALRRAGLDYHEFAEIKEYENYSQFIQGDTGIKRTFAITTKATDYHHEIEYVDGDCFLFGPETRGLPYHILEDERSHNLRIPMRPESRSLNLSNTAAIMLYQALSSRNFVGLK